MLFKESVTPATLELLKSLCLIKEFDLFGLGGGTSLALRMNHRISIDLDLFTNQNFYTSSIFQIVTEKFSSVELLFERNQTMVFLINDIKVDFVLYPFPWKYPFETIGGARLISVEDIIPMKLQAVSNRNAKKDYWDIAALLHLYPLTDMLKIFSEKFPQIDIGFIIHSLTEFEKADLEPDPDINSNSITWQEIKYQLSEAVKTYTTDLL